MLMWRSLCTLLFLVVAVTVTTPFLHISNAFLAPRPPPPSRSNSQYVLGQSTTAEETRKGTDTSREWALPLLSFGAALGLIASFVFPASTAHALEHTSQVSQQSSVDFQQVLVVGAVGSMVMAEDQRLRRYVLPSGRFRPCAERPSDKQLVARKPEVPSYMGGNLNSFFQKLGTNSEKNWGSNATSRVAGAGTRQGGDEEPSGEESETNEHLLSELTAIVGSEFVKRNYFQKGTRLGSGTAMAHVSPGTLKEAVQALKACVAADVAILPQGANTSLTGASVPRNGDCERDCVVINLTRLKKIMPVGAQAESVLCFAGAGIFDLKELLAKEYNRDSHSVLGSTFLNPTVGAGVAYGSGGTQARKGPAWTERALFCTVNADGEVDITNTLGLNDGDDIIEFLDNKEVLREDDLDKHCKKAMSVPGYADSLRELDSTIARSNADLLGPACCRSEGKVMILATMHDTYPIPSKEQIVWVSCKDYETANAIKREVALKSSDCMAKQCEYMNGDVYRGIRDAGQILMKAIEIGGMSKVEPLWRLKMAIESLPIPFANIITDKVLFWFNWIAPCSLPDEVQDFGKKYEHHLLMEFSEYSAGEIGRLQSALDDLVASRPDGHVQYHIFEDSQRDIALNWRFVAAPAFRTYCVGNGLQGLSIDYAIPKKLTGFTFPKEQTVANRWTYAHLGCNVYHEDFAFGAEVDVHAAKMDIKGAVEQVGGRLPAEHGHGTEYRAPKEIQARWKKIDPLNIMNPGVGGTSYNRNYAETPEECLIR